MKFLFTKKGTVITAGIILAVLLFVLHIKTNNTAFYQIPYEKVDISKTIRKEKLTDEDYNLIFRQTGVTKKAAEKIIEEKNFSLLEKLNDLYFRKPDFKKDYIAFPITSMEYNKSERTPLVPLQNGDILVTFNTHTLFWRHGHCALVLDSKKGTLLEHTSIGKTSCITNMYDWGYYPSFMVLRYSDSAVSGKAADYASKKLVDIPYNFLSGLIKKDKSKTEKMSSHCSHIVWQAYITEGVDVDKNGGSIVTPMDIAKSQKLDLVQIYGINPDTFIK